MSTAHLNRSCGMVFFFSETACLKEEGYSRAPLWRNRVLGILCHVIHTHTHNFNCLPTSHRTYTAAGLLYCANQHTRTCDIAGHRSAPAGSMSAGCPRSVYTEAERRSAFVNNANPRSDKRHLRSALLIEREQQTVMSLAAHSPYS